MQTKPRTAFSLTEVVVACTLLLAVMGTLAPLTIQCGRMWQESRHQQLAIDEMSNQLERLTLMDAAERQQAMNELTLSPPLTAALPSATVSAELVSDQHGERIELSLALKRPGIPSASPLRLVGWIDPMSQPSELTEDRE